MVSYGHFLPFSIMADTNFLFLSTLGKPDTQTLGWLVIGSFALGHVFGEIQPFFPFSIMADTNFMLVQFSIGFLLKCAPDSEPILSYYSLITHGYRKSFWYHS